ncbi:hypothetical protein AYX14_03980 [Cryptococcus neoformans]|nr:hypothetical protein AYX15_03849 [Cryptococcus neoformans var. grubii]OWZ70598.1 hypothetical protein AYX14_03980 [Cryptococcus neoformans var. grubii]OWZ74623.1 cytochrome c oxidase assembly protein subunit 17 [Cryptococcus neoformans var. grubii Bt85]OXG09980.1 cytochrome c oxidase assembly protein subunit 17 [Cryptococcus neoformans var. grubii Tu401-1]OXM75473.1 cytochrome c oxidase assembly protein subunit 17 [Cryptococcus neoformans var. grubii Bt63]
MVSLVANSSEVSSPATTLPPRSTSSSPDATVKEVNPLNPNNLKPCCACPETKQARDDCFIKSAPGEGETNCRDFIEAHKACMRGYGFKV